MNGKDEFGLTPRQRKFADFFLSGMYSGEALVAAGYSDTKAAKGAYQMFRRPAVREYLRIQREALARETATERQEIIHYLRRVIFTPIGSAAESHRDLIESESIRQHPGGRTSCHIRMVNKIAAVRLLCRLMGWTTPEQCEPRTNPEDEKLADLIRRTRARKK